MGLRTTVVCSALGVSESTTVQETAVVCQVTPWVWQVQLEAGVCVLPWCIREHYRSVRTTGDVSGRAVGELHSALSVPCPTAGVRVPAGVPSSIVGVLSDSEDIKRGT